MSPDLSIFILEDQRETLLGLYQALYMVGVVAEEPAAAPSEPELQAYIRRLKDGAIPVFTALSLDAVEELMVPEALTLAILDLTIRIRQGGQHPKGGLEAARVLRMRAPGCVRVVYTGAGPEVLQPGDEAYYDLLLSKSDHRPGAELSRLVEVALRVLGDALHAAGALAPLTPLLSPLWRSCSADTIPHARLAEVMRPLLDAPPPVRVLAARYLAELEGEGGDAGLGRVVVRRLCHVADALMQSLWEGDPEQRAQRVASLAVSAPLQALASSGSEVDKEDLRDLLRDHRALSEGLLADPDVAELGALLQELHELRQRSPKERREGWPAKVARLQAWLARWAPVHPASPASTETETAKTDAAATHLASTGAASTEATATPLASMGAISTEATLAAQAPAGAASPEPAAGRTSSSSQPIAAPSSARDDAVRRLRRHAEEARHDPWNASVMLAGAWSCGELAEDPEAQACVLLEYEGDQLSQWMDYVARKEEREAPPADPLSRYLQGREVWLVDDHAHCWVDGLRAVFGNGAVVRSFASLGQAAAAFEDGARPHLVLLDAYLPINPPRRPPPTLSQMLLELGISLDKDLVAPRIEHATLSLRYLAEHLPEVPVVIITRAREAGVARDCVVEGGASTFVFKNAVLMEEHTGGRDADVRAAKEGFRDLRRGVLRGLRDRAARRLGLEGRAAARLDAWLAQLSPQHHPLALDLLDRWTHIDQARLNALIAGALKQLAAEGWLDGPEGLVVVGASAAGKSGPYLFYPLWHTPEFSPYRHVPMVDLPTFAEASVEGDGVRLGSWRLTAPPRRVLLIDDFIGSGVTMRNAQGRVVDKLVAIGITEKEAPLRVAGIAACALKGKACNTLFGDFKRAGSHLAIGDREILALSKAQQQELRELHAVLRGKHGRDISGRARVIDRGVLLTPDSHHAHITEGDAVLLEGGDGKSRLVVRGRRGARWLAEPAYGPEALIPWREADDAPRFEIQTCLTADAKKLEPLGYNDGGALVSFEHNVPNNAPPLIWGDANGWRPLLRRRH